MAWDSANPSQATVIYRGGFENMALNYLGLVDLVKRMFRSKDLLDGIAVTPAELVLSQRISAPGSCVVVSNPDDHWGYIQLDHLLNYDWELTDDFENYPHGYKLF